MKLTVVAETSQRTVRSMAELWAPAGSMSSVH